MALLVDAIAAAEPPSIDDLRWIAPEADAAAALTWMAPECLSMPRDPERARLVALGRVAFRSPVLLGGLAARVGLRCDSCHRNGRDNPHFSFEGVSGTAGTADVTGAVFSRTRDDGITNPVPIPSLVDAATRPPFGSVVPANDLRQFVHTAITAEFAGVSPPERVLSGIVAYLEALESEACPSTADIPVTIETHAAELRATFDVASEAFSAGDLPVAEFAWQSLRAALQRLHQRWPEGSASQRELLRLGTALDLSHEELATSLGAADSRALDATRARLEETLDALARTKDPSYFDEEVLEQTLGARREQSPVDVAR